MFANSFPACAFFFFFQVEISSRTRIPLCTPGSFHGGSASRDDCDRVFPDELRVSSFLDRFPHCGWTAAWSAHSDFVASRMYACLGVTCHPQFWQSDRDLLRATAVTRGWIGHRIRVSTRKLTLEKKILPPPLPVFELETFRLRIWRSTDKLSRFCLVFNGHSSS